MLDFFLDFRLYILPTWRMIPAVPTSTATVKIQRKSRSRTMATYFQSSRIYGEIIRIKASTNPFQFIQVYKKWFFNRLFSGIFVTKELLLPLSVIVKEPCFILFCISAGLLWLRRHCFAQDNPPRSGSLSQPRVSPYLSPCLFSLFNNFGSK